MAEDSYISTFGNGGISFVGPDAVHLFRATTLKHGLMMLLKGITPTRGFTYKKGLRLAKEYTGKDYKRSQTCDAIADLDIWINTMKSALRVEDERWRQAESHQ